MIQIEEITLEKKELINKYFEENNIVEFTFTNIFLWRNIENIKYFIIDNNLCLIYKDENGNTIITFPIGNVGAGFHTCPINEIINYFKEIKEEVRILAYNEKTVKFLEENFPDKFEIKEDRDHSDYIYKIEDLINLSGNKYHKKKNHINKFKTLYNYEYKKITKIEIAECKELFDKWYNAKKDLDSSVEEAKEAIYGLFANYEDLDVAGGAIYVEGKIVAFSFGEKVNNKMVIIYYEYADTNYEGIFQMINQQFLENEWRDFEFVNRESDLGIEGLRKAKLSYHPEHMLTKYIATKTKKHNV